MVSRAVVATAVCGYLALTSAAITQLFAELPGQSGTTTGARDEATPAAAIVSGTRFDTRLDAIAVPNANSGLLTITIDGPNASVDFLCDTANGYPPVDHHVTPEQMMDAFHQWCSRLPDS